jgi:hypothetical protein
VQQGLRERGLAGAGLAHERDVAQSGGIVWHAARCSRPARPASIRIFRGRLRPRKARQPRCPAARRPCPPPCE